MGILMLSSTLLSAITVFPMIAGKLADRMGRSFKTWFIIGFFLPIISVFILFLLPDLSQENK